MHSSALRAATEHIRLAVAKGRLRLLISTISAATSSTNDNEPSKMFQARLHRGLARKGQRKRQGRPDQGKFCSG